MNFKTKIKPFMLLLLGMLSFFITDLQAQNRQLIGRQLQQSVTPYSIIVTDASNNQGYSSPGAEGTVLSISGGIPTWTVLGGLVTADNGVSVSGGVVQLGQAGAGTGASDFTADRHIYTSTFDLYFENSTTHFMFMDASANGITFGNNIAPKVPFHVMADAMVTANSVTYTKGEQFIVESSANPGNGGSMGITSSDTGSGYLTFSNSTTTEAYFGYNNAADWFEFGNPFLSAVYADDGTWDWFSYGAGTNTGTATYLLAVDVSGNVIEEAVSGYNENIYNTSSTTTANRTMNLDGQTFLIEGGDGATPANDTASFYIQPTLAGRIRIGDAGGDVNGGGIQIRNSAGTSDVIIGDAFGHAVGTAIIADFDNFGGTIDFDAVNGFILSNGDYQMSDYGSGTITGTATYILAVDASGNVIEEALPGGGTLTAADNGVSVSGTTVQLGHPASGTGASDFTANRYLYQNTFDFQIDNTVGTYLFDASENSYRVGDMTNLTGFRIAYETENNTIIAGSGERFSILRNGNFYSVNGGGGTSYVQEAYGGSGAWYTFYSDGTKALPTATQSGDLMTVHNATGYDGTTWSTSNSLVKYLAVVATENFSGTNQGREVQIHTAANGGVIGSIHTTFGNDGSLTLHDYGSGTFGDTDDAYVLSVDAAGNVQEMTFAELGDSIGGGGGADGNYAENNLIADANRSHTWTTFNQTETFTTGDFQIANTGDANAFFIDGATGNAGFGTTTVPSYQINVLAFSNLASFVADGGNGNIIMLSNNLTKSMTLQYGNTAARFNMQIPANSNDLVFQSTNGGTPESLRLDYTTGFVGVNSSNPDALLHVETASTGATPNIDSDDFFIEGTGDNGMTILGGTGVGDNAVISMGSSSDVDALKFSVNGTSTLAAIGTTNAVSSLVITSGASVTAATFNSSQALQLHDYGAGSNTGTATYFLAVTAAGNVIEEAASGLTDNIYVADGTLTGDRTMDMSGALYDLKLGDISGSSDELAMEIIQGTGIEMRYFKGVVNSEISILSAGSPGDVSINLDNGSNSNTMLFTDTTWDLDLSDGSTNSIAISYNNATPTASYVFTDGTTTNTLTINNDRTALGAQWATTGKISATITANQNNWSPTGLAGAAFIRLDGDAAYNITGMNTANWTDGTRVVICNVDSADDFTFVHESASSSASNRFDLETNSDYILLDGACMEIIYDQTSSRIRILK